MTCDSKRCDASRRREIAVKAARTAFGPLVVSRPLVRQRQIDATQTVSNAGALESIKHVVAGGGSSNMRILGLQEPLVLVASRGCRVRDVEGEELIDVNGGYGPFLFGYADQEVLEALTDSILSRGIMVGLPYDLDAEAASLVAELVPSIEQVRFANSGTEAVASSIRLARAATGRRLLVTFEGHYHGWSESVFHRLHPTLEELETGPAILPGAPGMADEALAVTLRLPWNDLDAVEQAFARHGGDVAAIIAEPVAANSGVIPPQPGFLEALRALSRRAGALLIFDEVITGFRLAAGGAQQLYGVAPDITVLSKALGGGFPVAAFGGSAEVMAPLATNAAFHGGVYAGNPAAMAAVTASLTKIRGLGDDLYRELDATGAYLEGRLRDTFADAGRDVLIQRAGSILSVALVAEPVERAVEYRHARRVVDAAAHARLQLGCQKRGVYFHPNPFEPWFLSTAHGADDLDEVCAVIGDVLPTL